MEPTKTEAEPTGIHYGTAATGAAPFTRRAGPHHRHTEACNRVTKNRTTYMTASGYPVRRLYIILHEHYSKTLRSIELYPKPPEGRIRDGVGLINAVESQPRDTDRTGRKDGRKTLKV